MTPLAEALVIAAGVGAAVAAILSRRRWRRVEAALELLAAGGRPAGLVAKRPGRAARVARKIAALADEMERLRRNAEEGRFNLDAVLSGMAEGVAAVDAGHVIRLVNASFRRLFELAGDPVGQTVLAALHDAAVEEAVRAAMAGTGPETREIAVRHPGKPARHLAVGAVAARDAAGKAGGAVLVFRDITRLREMEDTRREFVANVSHELRTPLAIFQGYLEMLEDNPDLPADEVRGIIGVMRKHSGRLNALVDDLLALARLESHREGIACEAIDLGPFLERAMKDWAGRFRSRNLAATVEIAPGTPPLAADPALLEQALGNLLDNAAKYTAPGGAIAVRVRAEAGAMILAVADTGIGIPAKDLPHIFERFYRVQKDRSRETGGTGLGLAIVKHIAERHGGSVGAESVPGQGTTISLRLPLAAG